MTLKKLKAGANYAHALVPKWIRAQVMESECKVCAKSVVFGCAIGDRWVFFPLKNASAVSYLHFSSGLLL